MDKEAHESGKGGGENGVGDHITSLPPTHALEVGGRGVADPCSSTGGPSTSSTETTSPWVPYDEYKAQHPWLPSLEKFPTPTDDVEAQTKLRKLRSFFDRVKKALGLASQWSSEYRVPEIIRAVDELPYGYGRVASYMTCDKNFLQYRRFGWLHIHTLLDLQDELQLLEEELETYHKENKGIPAKLSSRRLDYESDPSRKELIAKIRGKLREYHDSLLQLKQIQGLNTPSRRLQNSLHNIVQDRGRMTLREKEWILQRNDLAAIASNGFELSTISGFIETLLCRLSGRLLLAIFRTRDQKAQTGKEEAFYLVSKDRLDVVPRIMLSIVACVLLLSPVLILFKLQPNSQADVQQQGNYQVLTIFLFTLVFAACCSVFTKAKRQEVFTAAAAYCAVLVVFLGNSTNVMMVTTVNTPSGR